MTKRGRGRLKGGIGYPGEKEASAHNLPVAEAKMLREQETRLGVSKSALVVFALRRVGLYRFSLKDVEQDIRHATAVLAVKKTETRRRKWKPVLDA